ncbi:Probable type I restriction enzyme BthVORF4518P M protein [Geodia barretti]|uniref:site-specific DNA-methyltransferase (adenine-specific) n=1 Tax=Geodia barretti TaxID=519541 RepID=A0AA35SAR6_GEOBA|nr:Probable type I restriction enzyme BthVORF4518P M protein [Geodia barretti]
MINDETWSGLDIDVKGDIYEGLLQKNAEDIKSGAGQYFTPRPLIQAIVEVMRPEPMQTICDPACGTGGFFLAAHDYLASKSAQLDREQKQFLKDGTFHGVDLVDSVVRLCVMNLHLHGIGGDKSPVETGDSLISDTGQHFDMVLTNPHFGKKSSITIVDEKGEGGKNALTYEREDFWATTSNKQLNFLQHVKRFWKSTAGRRLSCRITSCLKGARGTVRKKLLHECDVHTLLRLPTGIFYAQGVKANVLFFDRRPASETRGQRNCGFTTYDQPAIHAENETDALQRPSRFHHLLQSRRPPRSERDRAV